MNIFNVPQYLIYLTIMKTKELNFVERYEEYLLDKYKSVLNSVNGFLSDRDLSSF